MGTRKRYGAKARITDIASEAAEPAVRHVLFSKSGSIILKRRKCQLSRVCLLKVFST